MTLTPTPLALAWLAARRAEALRIVQNGGAYTTSQRALAWATLASARRMRMRAMEGAR